jgi:hypothetical protein
MTRREAMKDSAIWQNIGEVAVQTGLFGLLGHSYVHLRLKKRFPSGMSLALSL